MKQSIRNLLSVILLIVSIAAATACDVPSKSSQLSNESTLPSETLGPNTFPMFETPVREYGEHDALITLDDVVHARIMYPQGGLKILDETCKSWANRIFAEHKAEMESSGSSNFPSELTVDYKSFKVNDRYTSVVFLGVLQTVQLAHPEEIMQTFTYDSAVGKIVSIEDVFSEEAVHKIRNLVIQEAGLDAEQTSEKILGQWFLTKEGLTVLLERGKLFAMSEGRKSFFFNYSKIGEEPRTKVQPNEPGEENAATTVLPTTAVTSPPETSATATVTQTDTTPVSANKQSKGKIALTFDDGPSQHTARLLDVFLKHGGKGTFFVVGNLLEKREDVLQRTVREGHLIAGHSWDHQSFTNLTEAEVEGEIAQTRAKILQITGYDTPYVRPPYGAYNDQVKAIAQRLGVSLVNWSIDTEDWKYRDADHVYKYVMEHAKDGAIILCHDLHGTSVDAMERAIPDLIAQGYELVTVEELLLSQGKIEPGNIYFGKY